jgi:hypothetical protein
MHSHVVPAMEAVAVVIAQAIVDRRMAQLGMRVHVQLAMSLKVMPRGLDAIAEALPLSI